MIKAVLLVPTINKYIINASTIVNPRGYCCIYEKDLLEVVKSKPQKSMTKASYILELYLIARPHLKNVMQ